MLGREIPCDATRPEDDSQTFDEYRYMNESIVVFSIIDILPIFRTCTAKVYS